MNCVLPLLQDNNEANQRIFNLFPYLRNIYDNQKLKSLPASNVHYNSDLNIFHFVFFGKYASSLEIFDFFDTVIL